MKCDFQHHQFSGFALGCVLIIGLIIIGNTPASSQSNLQEKQSSEALNLKNKAQQLLNQGVEQYNQGKYDDAINSYKQVLLMRHQLNEPKIIGMAYSVLGRAYHKAGKYKDGISAYQEAIKIFTELGEKGLEANQLNNLAIVYDSLGNYFAALSSYKQAIAIFQQLNNQKELGKILDNMSFTYYKLGKYGEALNQYQTALQIRRNLEDKRGEGITLQGIGNIYFELGQYSKSLKYYQQALLALKSINEPKLQGFAVSGIAYVYAEQGLYNQALATYQQALSLYRQADSRLEEGHTLNGIGDVYLSLKNYEKSFELLNQSLKIAQTIGDRQYEGRNLNSLGNYYKFKNEFSKSLGLYEQALAISQEIGDRTSQRITLSAIGDLLAQRQPGLAIIFYKQSVNVTESIRRDLQTLPRDHQQSYTQTVAYTYRQLADLLLKQNRVLEAQKVLDLLKLQELKDYLHNLRGSEQSIRTIETLAPEKQILINYGEIQKLAIEIGQEFSQLMQIPEDKRTPAQQQRINKLFDLEKDLNQQFNEFIESPEVSKLLEKLSQANRRQNLDLKDLTDIRNELMQIPNAVLLYPFIAEDRLELILTTADTPPLRRTVKVTPTELNNAIAEFRNKVKDKEDVQSIAQKLYSWLIKPLEPELQAASAKTIIYAPDGQLRYLPLAALYDGKQWLVERFAVNSITARSLDDLTPKPQPHPRVLAGAFTQGYYKVPIDNQTLEFKGLPFAGKEVESLAQLIPGTKKLLDSDFSKRATLPRMKDYNILHFATHAAFLMGKPEDSFILFGDGEWATLRDIENWSLPKVDLVVLSACETGLGGLGDGVEILGLGYQFQRTGARAAIASLWAVNDNSTELLMKAFYEFLQSGKTKAEAMRQAQLKMLHLGSKAIASARSSVNFTLPQNASTSLMNHNLSHPYYWAPFILIGNGL